MLPLLRGHFCERCHEEQSREQVTVAKLAHTYETVKENETAATCTVDGGCDSVV